MDFKSGTILSFDKPLEWTSFGLVSKVRYLLCKHIGEKKLKVGHAGTLDPLATGVLIICTGKATKQIDTLQAKTKEYVATLQLGATTPSFDLETPVDATYPTEHISQDTIEQALTRFIGRIEQVPPSYSACKVDGKRAYDLARQGKEVELKAKVLVIDEIELQEFNPSNMQATIRVVCSKGTYIRALARDIGLALESGAHLTALRRTRIGDYRVEECHTMETFQQWLETLPKETVQQ
ncbi:MAG: tRNA pseudouridine(55) synthase TruB [Bacteroidaceae bacterium]|nr:tRNA pseudouridine(55) synthase TruB [Bacteroidaceae bacterium]